MAEMTTNTRTNSSVREGSTVGNTNQAPIDRLRRLTVRLEANDLAALDALAVSMGESRSDLVRAAVKAYLQAPHEAHGPNGEQIALNSFDEPSERTAAKKPKKKGKQKKGKKTKDPKEKTKKDRKKKGK